MIFLFVKKTLKQQKGEISILVDSTQKGYITLYLQIGTSGVRVTESLVLCVMFCKSLFVLLAMVLSVLRFTDSFLCGNFPFLHTIQTVQFIYTRHYTHYIGNFQSGYTVKPAHAVTCIKRS